MQLTKAIIINTITGDRIKVMYNPEELKLEQGNNFAEIGIPGLNAPPIQYIRGRSRTLSMELFFDTYELGQDVRDYTGQLIALLDTLPQTKAPPILLFVMGQLTFQCVLVDAGQRFTMFQSDGTPVRSIVSARFQEYVRLDSAGQPGSVPQQPTVHQFAEGERLDVLAARYRGDPAQWPTIAKANNIDDPFNIPAGQTLLIPEGWA